MQVIVDDSDPLVQYNSPSGWIRVGTPSEFQDTTHSSAIRSDTATLEFVGTSISVYGTIAPSDGQSRMNFSIDGVTSSYQGPLVPGTTHNLQFWTSPILEEASHQLVVTVDEVTPLNRTFFLDYFIYTTTSPAAGGTVVIDDSDASVTYSSDWEGTDNGDPQLERTKHVSLSAGSWAAVAFEGTHISLTGPSSSQGFNASVLIDGSPAAVKSHSEDQNQIFNSTMLSPGSHTMNITVLSGGNSLAIDYFLITGGLNSPTPSPSESSPATFRPLRTSNPTSTPIAAIVGGTLGGLVILALILVAMFVRRRRAQARPTTVRPLLPSLMIIEEATEPPAYRKL